MTPTVIGFAADAIFGNKANRLLAAMTFAPVRMT